MELYFQPGKAIQAQNDLILMRFKLNEIKKVIKRVTKLIDINSIKEEQINASVERILNMKEKYNITDEPVKGCNIDEINKEIEYINSRIGNS